jgi:CubicO group peptidase (beta-lactamase class C family)
MVARKFQPVASLVVILLVAFSSSAQTAYHVGPTEPGEFEVWLDHFFADYLKNSPEPSVGFVLVKDGRIFFQKGYGYADYRKKTPVLPDQTLFEAASVSKLVTATAVMRLVEAEKLQIDVDINRYLKGFQLERNYPRPVTLANLLTHTGGIDDSFILGSVDRPSDLVPLGVFFAKHPPRRARPPGEEIVYSNWGMALAGHLVEAASGRSFHEYVEQNIFAPLGMAHSSFRNPLPPSLTGSLATAGVGGQPINKTAVELFPSEALVCTVADMGRFMIAHLNGGFFDNHRILAAQTVREMHRQHFTQHPHMPGIAYGFFESLINGRRGLFHAGSGGHESLLYLLPDERVGFYLVHSGELQKDFAQAFLDRYYPASPPFTMPRPRLEFARDANGFTGLYRPGFIANTTIEKVVAFIADTPVQLNRDGSLTVSLPPLGHAKLRSVQIEPLLFRAEGGFYIAFRRNRDGIIDRMFTSGSVKDPTAYDRLSWYESGLLHAATGLTGFLLFLSFLVVTLVGFIRRDRHRGEPRLAWRIAALVSGAVVLAPLPVLCWMVFGDHSRPSQFEGTANIMSISLMFASLVSIALPVFAANGWRRADWSITQRAYYTIVSLAACCLIPYLHHWNLLGFWYHR